MRSFSFLEMEGGKDCDCNKVMRYSSLHTSFRSGGAWVLSIFAAKAMACIISGKAPPPICEDGNDERELQRMAKLIERIA